ncbi:hypothetical protein D3C74_436270 [compost metagenome]
MNKDAGLILELKDSLYKSLARYVYGCLDHLGDGEIIELFKESLEDYRRDYGA